jgi:SAM-dependent methyltransferase
MPIPLYDAFSADYDRFVRWEQRLAGELPFIEARLAESGARRVLDVACGTGRHAIALSGRGYEVTGADPSAGMIDRARANAAAAGEDIRFVQAGFGELAACIASQFDALLCLGSSLPHVASPADLAPALRDFAAVLRPGGMVLIQNRNFDRVLGASERWMRPQAHREGDQEWAFVRFYDFNADGSLTFNVLTLYRSEEGAWQQRATATHLWPQRHADLVRALEDAGFSNVNCRGDMKGATFAPDSPNLIVTTIKGE